MKKILFYGLILYFIIIFLFPYLTLSIFNYAALKEKTNEITISLLDYNENKVLYLSLDEYIKGVTLSYIPYNFKDETLKAFCLIIRTYILKTKEGYGNTLNENHPEYDVCNNENCCIKYTSPKTYISNISKNTYINIIKYVSFNKRINNAIEKTRGEIITYKGEYINPYFFIASPGITENSFNFLNTYIPYLQKSISPYENNNPYMNIKTEISQGIFIKKLKEIYPDLILNETNIKKSIKILSYTNSNQTDKILIGNKTIDGKVLYEHLNLPSIWITDIKIKNNNIIFTTDGMGKGMGVSLYGADGYSKNSLDYKTILKKYYQGIIIKNIFNKNTS